MYISLKSARKIVEEMKKSIGYDVNIMDERGIILAGTDSTRDGTLHEGAARLIREGLPALVVEADDVAHGMRQGINLPIMPGGRVAGVIGITGAPEKVSVFGNIIKRMTELMIENIWQNDESDMEDRQKSAFLEQWLFSVESDSQKLSVLAGRQGLSLNRPYVVALVSALRKNGNSFGNRIASGADADEVPVQPDIAGRRIRELLQHRREAHCACIRGQLLILIGTATAKEAHAVLLQLCETMKSLYGIVLRCGMCSESVAGPDIRRGYAEAHMAHRLAESVENENVVVCDRRSPALLVRMLPIDVRDSLRRLIFDACADSERGEYEQLIRLYFACDGQIRRMADRLFVHANTIRYRMEQLRGRTGLDLRKPKDAIMLYMAGEE